MPTSVEPAVFSGKIRKRAQEIAQIGLQGGCLVGEYKAKDYMSSAATIRLQIESSLANRIPAALTPRPHVVRPFVPTGIENVDALLEGGLPLGAISELAGPECSGRTSLVLSFLARMTQEGRVCAWIDVSDALDPVSAAASGVDLERLLWVRCGVQPAAHPAARNTFALPEKCMVPPAAKKGLHGGGFGPHPRTETKGISAAVSGLLHTKTAAACSTDPQRRLPANKGMCAPAEKTACTNGPARRAAADKPWSRMEQAMRAADLLLQAGGFAAIVLDMGSIAPVCAARVPMATWFRYRAAAERTQASLLLLTQSACAKSSAELLLRFEAANARNDEATVFTGMEHRVELGRQRFAQAETRVVPIRKPPQRETGARWPSRATWAGAR